MKMLFGTFLVFAGLLALSVAFAEQDKARSYKYRPDALVYAELAKVPAKARARQNPLEKDPDAIAAGKNLFAQHCSECHGDSAEGGRKGPSLRAAPVQNAEPGAIFWVLTNGVVWRGMPVWSKLPEPQRWQLVRYIKSLDIAEQALTPAASAKSTSASPIALPSPLR